LYEITKDIVGLTEKSNNVIIELTQFEIPTDKKTKYDIFYDCNNELAFG
jgi:hypothetical protein